MTSDDPRPGVSRARRKLDEAELELLGTPRDIDIRLEASDRSWIARRIVWIFSTVVVAAFCIFALQGVRWGDWSVVATETSDLIRSVVLPVVTLILGYYFGRSGRI